MGHVDDQIFLFKESSPISFLLQLFVRGVEGRQLVCFNAIIKLEGNVITMSIDINPLSDVEKKELSNILTRTYKKKDYIIRNGSINNKKIELKINEEIRFTHFYTEKGKRVCSMTLKSFYYTYKGTERLTTYRLFSSASGLLSPYLTGLSVIDNKVVGAGPTTYESSCYGMSFYMFRDEHHVYVQTDGDIDILLRVLSLFFCNPIEYDMVYSIDEGGNSHIEVSTTQYGIQVAKRNDMLGYLFSGNVCLDHLFDFIETTKSCNANVISGKMIEAYINNYVRAEFLDNISKLLLYSSILEKMANVKIGTGTYDIIKEYLRNNHINVEKINDNVERYIDNATKKKLLDSEGKEIPNFVQLRNFFVHYLGSKEAEDFLKESDMLFYLKLTITILILKSIGITEIIFDKNFHKISVFDGSTIESGDGSEVIISKILINFANEIWLKDVRCMRSNG